MPKIKNVSPYGDLDTPLLRRVVSAGETVDVSDDQAERLLPQADNWAPADDAAQTIADRIHKVQEKAVRESLGIPDPAALKADWVAYAQQQGDADAEHKTKQQLIDEHGSTDGDSQ